MAHEGISMDNSQVPSISNTDVTGYEIIVIITSLLF
jgi:hypothetical protein